jgi:hypothetical protein
MPTKILRKCADGKVRKVNKFIGNEDALDRMCLAFNLGLTYREIAAREGCSEWTAYYVLNPEKRR